MSDRIIADIVTIATAIVGLAIISVLVSKQSNASGAITSAGSAFDSVIKAAVAPISSGGL